MAKRAPSPEVTDFPHGRVPRAVRERQLLGLAEELFAQRGYDGTSMDELASRARVSKPVIYDIVGSKEALFRRCFERAGDELASAVATAATVHYGDLARMLKASALAFLDFIEHHDKAWAVLYALDSGGRTDSYLQAIRARQARFVAALLVQLDPEVEPSRAEAVAYMLNGAFEALAHWRRESSGVSAQAGARWLVEFTLPGLERLLASRAGRPT
jgi:AcrR family transcriptional regulator